MIEIDTVIKRMNKTIRQSQRALDGEFGATIIMEEQTIIWFQERIKIWVELLETYRGSAPSANMVENNE